MPIKTRKLGLLSLLAASTLLVLAPSAHAAPSLTVRNRNCSSFVVVLPGAHRAFSVGWTTKVIGSGFAPNTTVKVSDHLFVTTNWSTVEGRPYSQQVPVADDGTFTLTLPQTEWIGPNDGTTVKRVHNDVTATDAQGTHLATGTATAPCHPIP